MIPKQKQDEGNRKFAEIMQTVVAFCDTYKVPESDLAMAITVTLSNHRNAKIQQAQQMAPPKPPTKAEAEDMDKLTDELSEADFIEEDNLRVENEEPETKMERTREEL
jgi:hypothetical protein